MITDDRTTVKGIVLPSGNAEMFKPLTYQLPVGLIPIVNKPLMEHQVELFVRHGIRAIRMSCNHLSNKVETYFQNGSRWGATISYNFERPPFGAINALHQMRSYFQGDTLVLIHADVVSDLDLGKALEFHRSARADATFVCHRPVEASSGLMVHLDGNSRIQAVSMHEAASVPRHPLDAGILIIEPDILDLVSDSIGYNVLQACWLASQSLRLNLLGYCPEEPIRRVTSWKSYYQVQYELLEGKLPGVLIPGIQVKRNVWVGKNVSASSNIVFQGPIAIGDNCRLGRGVALGPGTIINHDVMIDVGAKLERAIILPNTFVGSQTFVQDSIVMGNLAIDLDENSLAPVEDNLAAIEMQTGQLSRILYHFVNRLGGVILLVGLSPLMLLLFILLVLGIRFPLISRVKRIGIDLKDFARGKLRLHVFDLIYLGPIDRTRQALGHNPDPVTILPHVFSRLGNLWNVVTGDILLVGNRPMDPELAFGVTEEWRRTRFKCQSGLVSVLDTNEIDNMSQEEQIIAEGYYAVNRKWWMDIRILTNAIWRLLKRMLGTTTVLRETRPVQPTLDTPSFE